MEKEFIPYEQALALKELGFDEPCFGFYQENNNLVNKLIQKKQKEQDEFSELAPLYQQAFRWFRKKYKLNSRITENISDNKYFYCIEKLNVTKHEDVVVAWNVNMNITYEEAELECLKKLIEIITNKN